MMSLTFGLFTQVSGSGPLGPLVCIYSFIWFFMVFNIFDSDSLAVFMNHLYLFVSDSGTWLIVN